MFVSFNSLAGTVNSDFDNICGLIRDVMTIAGTKPQEQLAYVNKYFEPVVGSKDVREAYDLVFQVKPTQRYSVFKQAVENESDQSWDCPALNEYF